MIGLLGLLAVVLLVLLTLIFGNSGLSPFNLTPQSSENIHTKAQQVIDQTNENAKSEQNQIKNIDLR